MIQELVLILLFCTALAYLARLVYTSFVARKKDAACAKGCASCSAVDIAKIEAQITSQQQSGKR